MVLGSQVDESSSKSFPSMGRHVGGCLHLFRSAFEMVRTCWPSSSSKWAVALVVMRNGEGAGKAEVIMVGKAESGTGPRC